MKKENQIYFDYNATTPVLPEVLDVMLPYFTLDFGNPASDHIWGWEAEEVVSSARSKISAVLEAKPEEIFFFSGATEALNTVLIGYALQNKEKGNHIITCQTEHKAILESCWYLEQSGFEVTFLKVDKNGQICKDDLINAIKDETIIICLMLANNETGIIHPLKEYIKATCSYEKLVWIVDATQAIGKIPFSVKEIPADMVVFSAHKLYGPKGMGVLFKSGKKSIKVSSLSFGGKTEKGLRSGTVNVPGIAGIAKALEICHGSLAQESLRLKKMITDFECRILEIGNVTINGQQEHRLPNTSNITFHDIDPRHLIKKLNPLALSQGSACNALQSKPSHVLSAMGLSVEDALSSVRISAGRFSTESDFQEMISVFTKVIPTLRK